MLDPAVFDVRRRAAQHPDAGPDGEPAAAGADARSAARGRRRRRAAARRSPGAALTERLNARLDGLAAEHAADGRRERQGPARPRRSRDRASPRSARTSARSRRSRRIATHARDVARDASGSSTRCRRASARRGSLIGWPAEPGGRPGRASGFDARRCCASTASPRRSRRPRPTGSRSSSTSSGSQILNTIGATRDAFTRVQEQTTSPEAVTVQLRAERAGGDEGRERRRPAAVRRPPVRRRGRACSRSTSTTGSARSSRRRSPGPGFVAWYRNPGSATPASLRIAYQNDEEEWASLQPDFIVVSRRTDGTLGASIVDPHGDYLADARAKLRGARGVRRAVR